MTNAPPPDDSDFDATVLVRRMGHDFNNLFSIVLGGLSLLREEIPASAWDEDSENTYADIVSATREAAGVIVKLNAWSARQSIAPQDTDINDVVVQAGDLLRRALPDTVSLEVISAASPVMAWIDRSHLLDVLLELAANARDAMPAGGHLTISTSSDGEFDLSVSDTGTGMDEQTLQQCKQPYFTTRGSSTHRGLGLSVVDGFVRASNAELRISSESGKGSTVNVRFPPARGLGHNSDNPSRS